MFILEMARNGMAVAARHAATETAAAGAVDHFRQNRYLVELCPQGGGFFMRGVIVRERCDSGIAGFAVQPAAADQLVRVFRASLHKLGKLLNIMTCVHVHSPLSVFLIKNTV